MNEMNKTKMITLALVLVMVMSAFGMMMPTASAQIVSPPNSRDIRIWSTDLNNYIPGNPGAFGNYPIYPGSQNVNFDITIRNDDRFGFDTMSDDDPILYANLSISNSLKSATGQSVTTPISNWDTDRVINDAFMIGDGNSHTFSNFKFDVKANAVPGIYNLTVTLDYQNSTGVQVTPSFEGYILFEIKNRGTVSDLPRAGTLLPGDKDKTVEVRVTSNNNGNSEMQNVYLNITIPDSAFSWYGLTTGTASAYRDNIGSGSGRNFPYTISVNNIKKSGTYVGTYVLEYINDDGIKCRETGSIDFIVSNLAMLTASITTGTIAQGTVTTVMALTFTNTGTVDLLGTRVWIDDVSNDFFFTVADHWEGAGTVTFGWLELGNIAVGGIATANMDVGINLYIPEGKHKLMFGFSAKYMDPDTLTYKDTDAWWDWLTIQNVPKVNMDGTIITLDPDTSTVEGTFVWITITDTVLDVMLTSLVTLTTGGRTLDNALQLNVQNLGNIDYTNMVLQIETNTAASPFTNVVNPTAALSEGAPITGTLWAGSTRGAIIQVTLKPDTDLGVYMIPVTINAVNMNMGEVISTVVNARITIRGIGPQIEVTTVTPEKIKPGEAFTLTLVLTNVGDDTARNLVLNSLPNLFENDETTINGNYAVPQANALPLYLDDIAPGATLTVEIPMQSNSDMSDGHVYSMLFSLDYVDSLGEGPATETIAVTVKSAGNGGSVMATFYWAMVILAFVIAIFLIIVAIFHVKKNRTPKVPKIIPVQEYQQPPPPPMNQ